jgi:hypothetical protein
MVSDRKDKARMDKALERMTVSNVAQQRYNINSRLFAIIRKNAADAHSQLIKGLMVGKLNPFYGREHSEETKARISAANKGRLVGTKRDPKSVMQGANKLRGQPKKEAHKQALKDNWAANRINRVEQNHPMYGKQHNEESKLAMRESAKARWSDEYKEEFKKKNSKSQNATQENMSTLRDSYRSWKLC